MTEKMFETPKQQKFLANYFASLLKQNQLVHAYLLTGPSWQWQAQFSSVGSCWSILFTSRDDWFTLWKMC
jgi:hypothetical protein